MLNNCPMGFQSFLELKPWNKKIMVTSCIRSGCFVQMFLQDLSCVLHEVTYLYTMCLNLLQV